MTIIMVKYIQMFLMMVMVVLLASCDMENFPDLKNMPQIPEEKLQQNDDNRPSIEIENIEIEAS